MMGSAPAVRDVVLLGAGHSHVAVLRRFGMRPEPGLRFTIVAREVQTPYSGMLPGVVAGRYDAEEIHIDVARLAAFAGARLIADAAVGLEPDAQRVLLDQRPPLRYDLLSINVGGAADARLPDAPWLTPVKPIGRFLPRWRGVADALAQGPLRILVIGGGPGGVELALAMRSRFPATAEVTLATADGEVLAGHGRGVRRRLAKRLAGHGVEVVPGFFADAFENTRVCARDGRVLEHDHVFWVAGVVAAPAFADCGLETDEHGFIAVDERLRSVSHDNVFVSGDAAAMVDQPRPKSGVYAVRQGPVLAENLRRRALGRPLKAYRAQRRALALIGVGSGRAVASRGALSASGRWLWRWKEWLDRRFVVRFSNLPAMPDEAPALHPALAAQAPATMRCGGCGAKLGADLLGRVLARLAVPKDASIVQGIGDDAAVMRLERTNLVLTCDGFRAMIDDPYRFGRIAAHHALNDAYAMNATPRYALALVTVPAMADALMEEDLYQVMAGAVAALTEEGVTLVGGHSAEAAELSVGFMVAGAAGERILAKGGLAAGQHLVLNKPIGVGVVLAGAMRARAAGEDLLAAIEQMDQSNAAAVGILAAHGATACTDVTGFGLAGHLSEMTRAAGVGATLWLDAIPRLQSALDLMAAGEGSSLQENNERALDDYVCDPALRCAVAMRLLADPQTAGGLLAGVPAQSSTACVSALRTAGYPHSTVVGEATAAGLRVLGAGRLTA